MGCNEAILIVLASRHTFRPDKEELRQGHEAVGYMTAFLGRLRLDDLAQLSSGKMAALASSFSGIRLAGIVTPIMKYWHTRKTIFGSTTVVNATPSFYTDQ